jgi:hypothetical protein
VDYGRSPQERSFEAQALARDLKFENLTVQSREIS